VWWFFLLCVIGFHTVVNTIIFILRLFRSVKIENEWLRNSQK
jgi:hypothetical protein